MKKLLAIFNAISPWVVFIIGFLIIQNKLKIFIGDQGVLINIFTAIAALINIPTAVAALVDIFAAITALIGTFIITLTYAAILLVLGIKKIDHPINKDPYLDDPVWKEGFWRRDLVKAKNQNQ